MTELEKMEEKIEALLDKRKYNIGSNSEAEARFRIDFTAHTWLNHSRYGDGYEMLAVLQDDQNLISGNYFNQNWKISIDAFTPKKLINNKTWAAVFPLLLDFRHTKVGIGELALPLVVEGWLYQKKDKVGDGFVAGGKREIKKEGASLKPIKKSQGRVIDKITDSLFEGHRAGPSDGFHNHVAWMDTKPDPKSIYLEFFSTLYPGRDVVPLIEKLMIDRRDWVHWNYVLGQQVLEWYKEVDGWSSLIIIDIKKNLIANIADTSDEMIRPLELKFDWKSFRGNDSQALPDGYVNVGLAK